MSNSIEKLTYLIRKILNDDTAVIDRSFAIDFIEKRSHVLRVKDKSERDWYDINVSRRVWDYFLETGLIKARVRLNPQWN